MFIYFLPANCISAKFAWLCPSYPWLSHHQQQHSSSQPWCGPRAAAHHWSVITQPGVWGHRALALAIMCRTINHQVLTPAAELCPSVPWLWVMLAPLHRPQPGQPARNCKLRFLGSQIRNTAAPCSALGQSEWKSCIGMVLILIFSEISK